MASSTVLTKLTDAMNKKHIVNFARPFEPGTFTGYVLDVGAKFFLLASIDDGFEFEQYSVLRVADVRRLQSPAKYESFYKAARRLRGDKMPRRIKVDLTNQRSVVHSVSAHLLTVHFEMASPDTCNIGRLINSDSTGFELLEIAPGAKWDKKPRYFRFAGVTRIDLPGRYEKALLLVGGEGPD